MSSNDTEKMKDSFETDPAIKEENSPVKSSPAKGKRGTAKPKTSSAGGTSQAIETMPDADTKFLAECLRNSSSPITVDIEAVASTLDYANPRSVANRIAILRKKYDLGPITGKLRNGTSNDASPAKPAVLGPSTPMKVRKPRAAIPGKKASATPSKNGSAAKATKGRKGKKNGDSSGDEINSKNIRDSDLEEHDDQQGTDEDTHDTLTDANGKMFPNLSDVEA
ncbi:MAG: hypothetical protein M4579_000077 [Chaenotheca gracillima]|nr:MAG: hypothetical protein M4579_000077 [Chaenotheca gracillima]